MVENTKRAKRSLRRKVLADLAKLTQEEHMEKSRRLSQLLDRSLRRELIWGVFSPLPGEPQWSLEITRPHTLKWAYPKFKAPGEMKFFYCQEDRLVEERAFGTNLMCPPENSSLANPEALLVPALGYTARGERLGRGGGYYDRILKKFYGPKIGICFEQQLYHDLPVEEHDQKVSMIVTDQRTIHCPE